MRSVIRYIALVITVVWSPALTAQETNPLTFRVCSEFSPNNGSSVNFKQLDAALRKAKTINEKWNGTDAKAKVVEIQISEGRYKAKHANREDFAFEFLPNVKVTGGFQKEFGADDGMPKLTVISGELKEDSNWEKRHNSVIAIRQKGKYEIHRVAIVGGRAYRAAVDVPQDMQFRGGGVFIENKEAVVQIHNSCIVGNYAHELGGGHFQFRRLDINELYAYRKSQ